jgi:energy-coupling factor transporter ATP-binding protein EcfA2
MLQERAVLKKLYNVFKPEPLLADDQAYVDYQAVRGGKNVLDEIGQHILWSDKPTCSLFSGHRGCGKSTELLRLQRHLEKQNLKVIYFAADENDIDPEDARYTDILLACTRHILQELKDISEGQALRKWLTHIWDNIKELATIEMAVESVSLEIPFIKMNANLRGNPTTREKIRDLLDPYTVNLLTALNEFIADAEKQLKGQKLVLIVDNLDRITPVYKSQLSKTNLEEIFIDRCQQLKGLACHVVYTVPISLLYSDKATHLEDRYEPIVSLPGIKVHNKLTREPYQPGIDTLLELVEKRMQIASNYDLKAIFCDDKVIADLCLLSGGHLRNFIYLLRATLRYLPQAQTATEAANKAIANMRDTYRDGINEDDWSRLVAVYSQQHMPNETEYRHLLFGRSILEYYEDNHKWQDVHPLIWEIEKFKREKALHIKKNLA